MEKIIGFAVCDIIHGMPLLFQIMTDVEAPGRMAQTLTAYDKQDPHYKLPQIFWNSFCLLTVQTGDGTGITNGALPLVSG
jgi:hypothetical protein